MTTTNVSTGPKSNWEAQKAKLKAQFPKLTDDDLNFGQEKKVEFLNHMETKLALNAQEVTAIMESV